MADLHVEHLLDDSERPFLLVRIEFASAVRASEIVTVVDAGDGWLVEHQLDGSGARLRPDGEPVYLLDDRPRRRVPAWVVRDGALSLRVRERIGRLLDARLQEQTGSARREEFYATADARAGEFARQGEEEQDKLSRLSGFFENLRDHRETGEDNFTPASRAGRPAVTREHYEAAMRKASRKKGATDADVAAILGVHPKSIPRLRRRLGIQQGGDLASGR